MVRNNYKIKPFQAGLLEAAQIENILSLTLYDYEHA